MITLFGATGYTGQLVARALERAGLPLRLAGRSTAKLAALSACLPSRPACLAADVRSPETLAPLFDGAKLVVNCAGPFTDLGEPVVAQAAARGVHYLDITNELAYTYRLRQYHALAHKTGAAIVPACGFEVAIADCAVALLSRNLPKPVHEVNVTYAMSSSGLSVGTRLSGLRTFATSWLAYRDGKYVGQAPGASVRRTQINERTITALAFPSAEVVTIPAHTRVQAIGVWLAIAGRSARWATALMPSLSWLLRTPLGWLTAEVFKRLAPPAPEAVRLRDKWAIKIELRAEDQTRSQLWTGRDPYGLTAEIVAHAAGKLTAAGYSASGVLAPAQALEPEGFGRWLQTVPEVVMRDM